jgi:hypothetical protein
MPDKLDEYDIFLSTLHQQSDDRSLKREKFIARKGDAVIWNADLAHGGNRQLIDKLTKKSIVTYYCLVNGWPMYGSDGKFLRIKCGELQYYSGQRRD